MPGSVPKVQVGGMGFGDETNYLFTPDLSSGASETISPQLHLLLYKIRYTWQPCKEVGLLPCNSLTANVCSFVHPLNNLGQSQSTHNREYMSVNKSQC